MTIHGAIIVLFCDHRGVISRTVARGVGDSAAKAFVSLRFFNVFETKAPKIFSV